MLSGRTKQVFLPSNPVTGKNFMVVMSFRSFLNVEKEICRAIEERHWSFISRHVLGTGDSE